MNYIGRILLLDVYNMKKFKNDVKIVVATHKNYKMPKDEMYIPVLLGAEGKKNENSKELDLGFMKDNIGDNISLLNSGFCELTGLYWGWKNLNAEYLGLVHYRRHFSMGKKSNDIFENILTYNELQPLLNKYKIFVPKKRFYIIETLYSHYKHTHHIEHLDKTRKIINFKYKAYVKSFDKVMNQRYGYMFNMMIMEKSLLDQYCAWLFDILFELEKDIDVSELSFFQGRLYGRISEILLNVWIEQQIEIGNLNKNQIKELQYIHTEKINWIKKGTAFLKAKFFYKKYEGSF